MIFYQSDLMEVGIMVGQYLSRIYHPIVSLSWIFRVSFAIFNVRFVSELMGNQGAFSRSIVEILLSNTYHQSSKYIFLHSIGINIYF